VDTASCFLQGDAGTKVKKKASKDAGKNMVGEALQAPLFPSSGSLPSPQQSSTVKTG
jgi:hypothetical protein